jgi:hypothetical protein
MPVVFPAPDLVVGRCGLYYKEDDHLKETPEKSVHLVFVSEYPEAQWLFEEKHSLTMEPAPPVAYKQCPLPTEETIADRPCEPHVSLDYRYGIESFYLEGLNAQGIVTKWKESPWLPRREFGLGGTNDDPEGSQPLSEDSISLYRRVAKAWRWSRFQRNATAKKIVIPPRQAKRRRWAKRHWFSLAAFAWDRFLKNGPGWVVAQRTRKRPARSWFLDGYQLDYVVGSPDYDPRKSICLGFEFTDPEETRSAWDEWCLTMEPPPPVAYGLHKRKCD